MLAKLGYLPGPVDPTKTNKYIYIYIFINKQQMHQVIKSSPARPSVRPSGWSGGRQPPGKIPVLLNRSCNSKGPRSTRTFRVPWLHRLCSCVAPHVRGHATLYTELHNAAATYIQGPRVSVLIHFFLDTYIYICVYLHIHAYIYIHIYVYIISPPEDSPGPLKTYRINIFYFPLGVPGSVETY